MLPSIWHADDKKSDNNEWGKQSLEFQAISSFISSSTALSESIGNRLGKSSKDKYETKHNEHNEAKLLKQLEQLEDKTHKRESPHDSQKY